MTVMGAPSSESMSAMETSFGRTNPGRYLRFSRAWRMTETSSWFLAKRVTSSPFLPRRIDRAVPQLPAPSTATSMVTVIIPDLGGNLMF